MRLRPLLLAAACTLASAACAASLDPLAIDHPDFVRHADPALWEGLSVQRREVSDGAVDWRLWRITNRIDADGPLWVVPHDDENGAFAAGLYAVQRWGGTLIAVDSGPDDHLHSARYVRSSDGRRVDPNRAFTAAYPNYTRAVLADLRPGQPIVALHTNAAGFDPGLSSCGNTAGTGSGGVSIRLCNATYTPRPARTASYPWDDEDSVIIAPYLAGSPMQGGWCAAQLGGGTANVSFERVGAGDGSLSNYAAQRGLAYLNFETRDRGADTAGVGVARDRLVAMLDRALAPCLPPDRRMIASMESAIKAR